MSIDVHLDGSRRVRYGQFTSAGLRPVNEDCLGIRIPEGELLAVKGLALVIADGVSAADAGKEAGEICVLGFLNDYYATPDDWPVKPAATRVLSSLNEWLFSEGGLFSEDRKSLICALSALVLKGRAVHVFNVGDTRVYRMRGAALEQVTQDHTARGTGSRRFLARAMGLDLNLDLDHWREDAHEGDVYLLTTDGVHDHVGRREMEDLVAAGSDDFDLTCRGLGELALQRGSTDNLSAQLVRVESLPAATRREFCEERMRLPVPPELERGHTQNGYEVLSEFSTDLRRRKPDHVAAADRPLRERSPMLFWLGLAAVALIGALLIAVLK
jgi:serine/threonine protein phosphatase PrpC